MTEHTEDGRDWECNACAPLRVELAAANQAWVNELHEKDALRAELAATAKVRDELALVLADATAKMAALREEVAQFSGVYKAEGLVSRLVEANERVKEMDEERKENERRCLESKYRFERAERDLATTRALLAEVYAPAGYPLEWQAKVGAFLGRRDDLANSEAVPRVVHTPEGPGGGRTGPTFDQRRDDVLECVVCGKLNGCKEHGSARDGAPRCTCAETGRMHSSGEYWMHTLSCPARDEAPRLHTWIPSSDPQRCAACGERRSAVGPYCPARERRGAP